ncbi:MAG TPA: GAF domain-containing sensor histidine kinase [Fimbriimonadaceae bacterium]|jgi:signal transduction histidine kinase
MDTNEQLIRAVHTATRKLVSTGNFDSLLKEVLKIAVDAVGATGGTIYVHDPLKKRLVFQHVIPEDVAEKLPFKDMPDDAGVAGQVFHSRKTQVSEFNLSPQPPPLKAKGHQPAQDIGQVSPLNPLRMDSAPGSSGGGAETRKEVETATGIITKTMVTVPLMLENEQPIGVVQLINKKSGTFNETDLAVLDTVAAVSTMAFLNSQLMEESSRASTLLGMGKVSHDIGNLAASLFANISFSEMAMDGMRDHLATEEAKSETALMYLDSLQEMYGDLKASVERIVGYSRLVSDLSAGRALRPNKVLAPMSETIKTSAAYLESEGRNQHVAIRYDVADDTPALLHDELYLFRIVQNLVGNAIKAVKETIPAEWEAQFSDVDDAVFGEVTVRYRYKEGQHIVEVQDSGPGMSDETAERILSGNAKSQWDKGGGSGWGTKIVLELAATHDAKVSIDSKLGKGSTFRVVFPQRESNVECRMSNVERLT